MSRYETAAPEGQPTHVPAVRITGVETGSDRYNALLEQYRGTLAQFHLGQQQQVAISGQRYYKASRVVPGARMTYQNNEGQETITLELTTAGGGEELQIDKDAYWSWAIVEVTIPNIMGLTSSVASAFMTPPPKNKLGIALNKTHPIDVDRPPLSYPIDELGTFIGDVQDNTYHASLRVDLRPYPGGVKFDLYGYIRKYTTTGPGPNTSSAYKAFRGANSITGAGFLDTVHDFAGTAIAWPGVNTIASKTQTNVEYKTTTTPANIQLDFPELVGQTFSTISSLPGAFGLGASGPSYAGSSLTWGSHTMPTDFNAAACIAAAGGVFSETTTFGTDGIVKKVRGLGAIDSFFNGTSTVALNGAGPTQSQGNWGISYFDYTLYFVGDHPTVTSNVFPARDCPVSFIVLDDSPDAMSNRFGSPLKDNTYRWEASKKYPARWSMKQIGTVHMVGVDDAGFPFPTQGNHYSMIKLGTVIIHPRKGKGGIKFIAA